MKVEIIVDPARVPKPPLSTRVAPVAKEAKAEPQPNGEGRKKAAGRGRAGGRRGQGKGRGGDSKPKPLTAEELDAQMDAYGESCIFDFISSLKLTFRSQWPTAQPHKHTATYPALRVYFVTGSVLLLHTHPAAFTHTLRPVFPNNELRLLCEDVPFLNHTKRMRHSSSKHLARYPNFISRREKVEKCNNLMGSSFGPCIQSRARIRFHSASCVSPPFLIRLRAPDDNPSFTLYQGEN